MLLAKGMGLIVCLIAEVVNPVPALKRWALGSSDIRHSSP